jgi:hypothetical protein
MRRLYDPCLAACLVSGSGLGALDDHHGRVPDPAHLVDEADRRQMRSSPRICAIRQWPIGDAGLVVSGEWEAAQRAVGSLPYGW